MFPYLLELSEPYPTQTKSGHEYIDSMKSFSIRLVIVRLPNEDFGCNLKNSPHKIFLHKCVLQYVRTLKLNDATLASLGKLKYSRWRPRWPPKDKILNIFLSMWARHIIFVATHRFLRSRNLLSMLKFISDILVTCKQNGGQKA